MYASKCHQSDTVEFESYIPLRRSITLQLYKILHGKTRPGGMQYQTLKREDVKVKTEPRGVQGCILRGRGRGRTTILM